LQHRVCADSGQFDTTELRIHVGLCKRSRVECETNERWRILTPIVGWEIDVALVMAVTLAMAVM